MPNPLKARATLLPGTNNTVPLRPGDGVFFDPSPGGAVRHVTSAESVPLEPIRRPQIEMAQGLTPSLFAVNAGVDPKTLTLGNAGGGWQVNNLKNFPRKNLSAAGKITTGGLAGTFRLLWINSISGTPTIYVRNGNGGTIVASMTAAPDTGIDQTGAPISCPAGIWVDIVGGFSGLDMDVVYSEG